MALTDKQRRFVDAKVRGASNKEAAEAAGCVGSSAAASGSRWAKDPKIIAAIEVRKSERNVNGKARYQKSSKPPCDDVDDLPAVDEADGEFLTCLPNTEDPLEWLLALMNEPRAKVFDRRNAAQTAMPYVHGKKADLGKKEQKGAAAKEVSKGRYAARPAPKLAVDNTRG
ncbi:TPA: terminase small subunit [Pseudomonas aeruginosa]|nr:terminase small subunit [Pseudomonas aeruginosa]HCF3505218.1 terminase small subunit [Pseudomonas aeruginosa]